MSDLAIDARALTRRFGEFTAVDAITFHVTQGEVFGFLGANGAGKTTAIRMLIGLLEPTSGTAMVAGFDVASDDGNDDVRSILIDLLKRESANFSTEIRRLILGQMRKEVKLARQPARSAAFKVLRQTHAPAVLIELGYMSHAEDAQLLRSAEWQKRVAAAIAGAVEQYFTRHAESRR